MGHDVFISHSTKDKPIADAVCNALEANKVRCWYAPRDVRGGAKWTSAIIGCGAWLTADFVEAAVGNSATVLKPAKEKLPLESVPPDKIIHSMVTLGRSDRERNKEQVLYWVVTHFDRYAGPPYPNKPEVKLVGNDDRDA